MARKDDLRWENPGNPVFANRLAEVEFERICDKHNISMDRAIAMHNLCNDLYWSTDMGEGALNDHSGAGGKGIWEQDAIWVEAVLQRLEEMEVL